MQPKEQITITENEKFKYDEIIKNLGHEKIALDQCLVKSIQECLDLRKQILVKDAAISDLTNQVNMLMEKNNSLENQIVSQPSHDGIPLDSCS